MQILLYSPLICQTFILTVKLSSNCLLDLLLGLSAHWNALNQCQDCSYSLKFLSGFHCIEDLHLSLWKAWCSVCSDSVMRFKITRSVKSIGCRSSKFSTIEDCLNWFVPALCVKTPYKSWSDLESSPAIYHKSIRLLQLCL